MLMKFYVILNFPSPSHIFFTNNHLYICILLYDYLIVKFDLICLPDVTQNNFIVIITT